MFSHSLAEEQPLAASAVTIAFMLLHWYMSSEELLYRGIADAYAILGIRFFRFVGRTLHSGNQPGITQSKNQPAGKAQNRTPCRPPDGGSIFRRKIFAFSREKPFPRKIEIFLTNKKIIQLVILIMILFIINQLVGSENNVRAVSGTQV